MSAAPVEDYQEGFTRIEAEVERGNTDLSSLGFWRLVRQVKLEPRLAHHWADVIGRIDRTAFERRVRPRFPVWLGNVVLGAGSVALIAAIPAAIQLAGGGDAPGVILIRGLTGADPRTAGVLAIASAVGLSVTLHDPAHWLVGRLVGMRFLAYFFHRPFLQPGLKIDQASYLRTSPGARAWMHASGAIASKLAPFAVFAAVYLPHRDAGYHLFPAWSLWAILAYGVVGDHADALLSTKKSDWKRFLRERRIARSVESIPRR